MLYSKNKKIKNSIQQKRNMSFKQLINSLIIVVIFNICVQAQFLNLNTGPQQQNVRNFRQQPTVQQQRRLRPQQQQNLRTTTPEIDTIIIIETEPERSVVKSTQRQQKTQNFQIQQQSPTFLQNQQKFGAQQAQRPRIQSQNPKAQPQIQQRQRPRQPQVQQNQRQQTTSIPQRQKQSQSAQTQGPTLRDAPIIFSGSTNRPQTSTNTTSATPEIDTIIIIETEPERPVVKSTQRQKTQHFQTQQQSPTFLQNQQKFRAQKAHHTRIQSENQQPQNPIAQPQIQQRQRPRQPQTQQNQRQQTASIPQRQQQFQSAQTQGPTHEDAPIIFPGSINRPQTSTKTSFAISKPNNPFFNKATSIPTISEGFSDNSGTFVNVPQNEELESTPGTNLNDFRNSQKRATNPIRPAQNLGLNNGDEALISSTGQANDPNVAATNGFVKSSNGLENNLNSEKFSAELNNFNNVALNGVENVENNVGNSFASASATFNQSRWFNPRRPELNYYRNFATIFNDIDQKAEKNYNTLEESNEINDDFNGRSVVSPGQYPHMAALGYRTSSGETEFTCGGSLISETYVLTAAHCCYLNGQAPHLVKLGDIKLKEYEQDLDPQRRGIARIHKHPYYNESMHYHDIGLLELANPIEFTFFVRPIRLWARDEIPYSKVFTMGYGSTSFAKAPTNVLTELDLSIVPLETCNKTMPSDPNAPYGITESQICAKDFKLNRDTCQGDSGGPLQLNLERPRRQQLRYYLVGVISYGTFCRSKYPGVYTRVSSYIDWIASIVWPSYFNEFDPSTH